MNATVLMVVIALVAAAAVLGLAAVGQEEVRGPRALLDDLRSWRDARHGDTPADEVTASEPVDVTLEALLRPATEEPYLQPEEITDALARVGGRAARSLPRRGQRDA